MKKIFFMALMALCLLVPTFAADWQHEDNVSDLSYVNVTIYKIYDHVDAYVVKYAKAGLAVGQVVIPKSWFKDRPAQLEFRQLTRQLTPYMTVLKKGGEFYKVILTLPTDRNDKTWGVLSHNIKIDTESVKSVEVDM
ncbi:MAG: hypothetical protein K6F69_01945 [Treponema sp.]|nr:hypothetical protein [Treponema sp.]